MEDEPIYDFAPLKSLLTKLGYRVEKTKGYRELRPEEVDFHSIQRGEIIFRKDGIFIKSEDCIERRVFLYKRDYRLEQYGKPRFHISNCQTIQEFIKSGTFREHYVRANTKNVPVYNIDNYRREEIVSDLPLCRYCLHNIREWGNINSTQFVEILKKEGEEDDTETNVEVDLFGYTRDWDFVSKEYRENKDYTCEKCGLNISDVYDRIYMHVHHINGNKLNNNDNNLQCLCYRCHSEVDEHHKQRLTTGSNRYIYEDFIRKYGKKAM